MGRLDRRTADNEDNRSAQEAAERLEISRAEQLRQAETDAARTAAQEAQEHDIYRLVDEFLELMEQQDYPHLETVILPVSRRWWQSKKEVRKAVWVLYDREGSVTQEFSTRGIETSTRERRWQTKIYLLPEEGLMYHGQSNNRVVLESWSGQDAQTLAKTLRACVSHLRTGMSEEYYGYWPLHVINHPYR